MVYYGSCWYIMVDYGISKMARTAAARPELSSWTVALGEAGPRGHISGFTTFKHFEAVWFLLK